MKERFLIISKLNLMFKHTFDMAEKTFVNLTGFRPNSEEK